ncbi:MAG: MDR family MFS transporter [Pseudonocardia sp.]
MTEHTTAEPAEDDSATDPPPMNRGQTVLVLGGLMLATLLATLDTQIVATALPTIVGDLGGLDQFAWVGTAYLLTLSIATPLGGKLGDLVGRKPVFLTAVTVFLVGSALAGLAQTMTELIAFRALQGIGAGGLTVSVFAIIGEVFGRRDRARYQALFAIVFVVSSVTGPLLGGVLTQYVGWRSVFYINLPLGALVLVAAVVGLHLHRHRGRPNIDVAGALLLGGAATTLILLTSRLGTASTLLSAANIVLTAATVVLGAGWVLAERHAADPVIPLPLFRRRGVTLPTVISFVAGFSSLGLIIYLALFLQIAGRQSATNSGLLLLPGTLGLVAGSIYASKIVARTGNYKPVLVASMALGAAASVLLFTMDANTSHLVFTGFLFLWGLAAGLSQQIVVIAVQDNVERGDLGASTGVVTFARVMGSTLGIAVFGAVLNARLGTELSRRLPSAARDQLPTGGAISPDALRGLPAALQHGVAEAYAHALSTVFLTGAPVLLLGLIAALMLRTPAHARPHRDVKRSTNTFKSDG